MAKLFPHPGKSHRYGSICTPWSEEEMKGGRARCTHFLAYAVAYVVGE